MSELFVKTIEDEKVWKDFLIKANCNTFLQSTGYEKFSQNQDHRTFKLGMFDGDQLVSIALVYKIVARRGRFLVCSHGPEFLNANFEQMAKWTRYLKNLAIKENCSFVRSAPILEKTEENINLYKKNKWRKAPIHIHAEQTVVVDLTQDEKSILMNMRKTTRQMCKKAESMLQERTLQVEWAEEITEEMFEVYDHTAKRGGFVPFSRKYLKLEYEAFKQYENAKMIVIRNEDKILSWGMFIYANNRCFYHQGANLLNKDLPAAYLMHWEGMKMAKSLGCISYDFWGVSPENAKNHPWQSISLFKKGFGGQYIELIPAQDLIITTRYFGTWIIEKVRRLIRGF